MRPGTRAGGGEGGPEPARLCLLLREGAPLSKHPLWWEVSWVESFMVLKCVDDKLGAGGGGGGEGRDTSPRSTQRPPAGREPPPAGKRKREGIQLRVLQQAPARADLMLAAAAMAPSTLHLATHPGDPLVTSYTLNQPP